VGKGQVLGGLSNKNMGGRKGEKSGALATRREKSGEFSQGTPGSVNQKEKLRKKATFVKKGRK